MNIKYLANGHGGITAPNEGDAGYDLYANEDIVLYPSQLALVKTGVAVAIPEGCVGLIMDRSSVAAQKIATFGGVIDSSYTGEISVILKNMSLTGFEIKNGQKIAQMIIVPCYTDAITPVQNLGITERGENGFGSTGNGL